MPTPSTPDRIRALLEAAVSAYRSGRLDDAERGYREVLRAQPDNADALHLLGLLSHRQGREEEALALMNSALVADPTHAVALANRGLVLRALDRVAEANASLERAVALRPDLKEAWLNLARGRAALGQVEGAITAAQRGSEAYPAGLKLLAALLSEAGRWREAAAALAQVIALGERESALLALLASALQEAGEGGRAGGVWRAAASAPDAGEMAFAGLGGWLLREGHADEAMPWLSRALQAAPDRHDLPLALTDAASQATGSLDEAALLGLLRRDGVDHQRLERHICAALERIPGVPALLDDPATARDVAARLLDHEVFQLGLRVALLRPPTWERALSALREAALDVVLSGHALPRGGVSALAEQAWNTEYAAAPSPDAVSRATPLVSRLSARPVSVWRPEDWDALGALAALAPLAEQSFAETLASPGWEDRPLSALIRQQLIDPAEERALLSQVPELTQNADAVSGAVRQMYEENPYPRLVCLHRRAPSPLGALLRTWLRRPDLSVVGEGALRILVAGCGTGQHAMGTATRTANASVLAVDLSRASLARATRLARSRGIQNLRFASADILALTALNERFHVIESVGVLHHLDDPAAGLRVLADLLVPGGLMQLGLYSERGRQDVVAGRALIAEAGWTASPEGIRAARAAIQALPPEHPAAALARSPDFASLSGTRDLLFHVCERRFSPLGLAALLGPLDLEFLGFQHSQPSVGALYRQRFPDDPLGVNLAQWETLEDEHPRLFSGMFVFWCRRR